MLSECAKQTQRRHSRLDQTKNKSSLLAFKMVAADAVKFKQTVEPKFTKFDGKFSVVKASNFFLNAKPSGLRPWFPFNNTKPNRISLCLCL